MALAQKMGYEVKENGPDWFTLSRNDITLEMWQIQTRSKHGVMGKDRILTLDVGAEVGGSSRTVCLYQPDTFLPCADPAVQKEIDRAMAIFG